MQPTKPPSLPASPPHSRYAEHWITATLLNGAPCPPVRVQDFYTVTLRAIYAAARAVERRGVPPGVITVADELARHYQIDDVRDARLAVQTLIDWLPCGLGVDHYASVVQATAGYRRMILVGARIITLAYAGHPDDGTALQRARMALARIRMGAGPCVCERAFSTRRCDGTHTPQFNASRT